MVKSADVYRTARLVLAPWFKSNGFKRGTSGMLAWYRPQGDRYLTVWLQVSQWGWSQYDGSQFTMEFQSSADPGPGGGGRRRRFGSLLTVEQRERLRSMQNEIIAGLVQPTEDVVPWANEPGYAETFLPMTEPYGEHHDIWLRYMTPDDVWSWANFLLEALPDMMDRFLGDLSAS